MNYLGKVFNNWKYFYGEINAATLTGAIDVVIVEQPDGSYTCSPFHVRFGKMGVLRSKEKIVDIEINGEPVDIHMKLGESGEAFFVEEVEEENVPPHLACSPIPPDSGEETSDLKGEEEDARDGGGGREDPSGATVSSLPKTFRAETIEEGESSVLESVEFRPITVQNSSTSLSGLDTDFNKDDSPSGDERSLAPPQTPATPGSNASSGSNKRKRRKKSTKKKSNAGQNKEKRSSLPGPGQQTTEEEPPAQEVIFQLDDLEEPADPSGPTPSQPVPPSSHPTESSRPLDLSGVPHDGRDIHFFSDTEITPGSRSGSGFRLDDESLLSPGFHLVNGAHILAFPRDGCDFGPIQSDSEFETKRYLTEGEERRSGEEPSGGSQWKWGELPTSSSSLDEKKQDSQKWMLQSMLGFMKKTKHMRHKSDSAEGGIYLSDLNSDDPEMAALYFPSTQRKSVPSLAAITGFHEEEGCCLEEEDAESGNGPSLPQSPHSVEGSVCGPVSKPSESAHFHSDRCYPEDLALSLCPGPAPPSESQFLEGLISYSQFVENPTAVLSSPKLVVRFGCKYYSWKAALPLLVSVLFFNKALPPEKLSQLSEGEIKLSEEDPQSERRGDRSNAKKSYTWWWSSKNPKYENNNNKDESSNKEEETKQAEMPTETDGAIKFEDVVELSDTLPSELQPPTDLPLDLSPQSRQPVEVPKLSEDLVTTEGEGRHSPGYNSEKFRKTLRLTSAQIAGLKLKPGANEIQFSVTTAYQGTSRCKCFLFSWRYDDKIVISDIDGTITKSDVLGHILPIVGKDWAQSGVAKLFTKIKENGYKLLYLSARAIGQSRVTREYLKSIKQEDLGLPEGPMLLNPTSLLTAFHTEVIEKKPEEFKISCLRDIQALFPSNVKPFYAGYGNKINDVWAYQAVGIPIFRIFTINHRGELKHELTQTFQSSYTNMSGLVDQMFPPNNKRGQQSSEDFSQFVYWREPIPDIELEISTSQTRS